jgi:hypothetical protein
MNKTSRILISLAISIGLNIILLVMAAGSRDGSRSVFWRAVDTVSTPSTLIADALFAHGHSPGEAVFQATMCSIVYYAVILWVAIALISSVRKSMRRRGTANPSMPSK